MEIVQSDTESMLIISCNDEAKSYLANIPDEYQEVEYIQSSWSQYINTNFAYSQPTWQIKVKYLSTQFWSQYHTYRLWWSYNSSSPTSRSFILYVNYSKLRLGLWTGDSDSWISLSTNTIYELEETITTAWTVNIKLTPNWWNTVTATKTYSWTIATNNNFYIFANNETGSPWSYGRNRLYYLQLYQAWELVRDFVPCYRKSDNVIWLYDKVNGVFYTNQWSWSFTKWPDYKR